MSYGRRQYGSWQVGHRLPTQAILVVSSLRVLPFHPTPHVLMNRDVGSLGPAGTKLVGVASRCDFRVASRVPNGQTTSLRG